jgi:hypothetical protein
LSTPRLIGGAQAVAADGRGHDDRQHRSEYGIVGAFQILRHQLTDPKRFDRNLGRLLDGFEAELRDR